MEDKTTCEECKAREAIQVQAIECFADLPQSSTSDEQAEDYSLASWFAMMDCGVHLVCEHKDCLERATIGIVVAENCYQPPHMDDILLCSKHAAERIDYFERDESPWNQWGLWMRAIYLDCEQRCAYSQPSLTYYGQLPVNVARAYCIEPDCEYTHNDIPSWDRRSRVLRDTNCNVDEPYRSQYLATLPKRDYEADARQVCKPSDIAI